jgi:hypothetical protein
VINEETKMKPRTALSTVIACAFLQVSMAAAQEKPGLAPTPGRTATDKCRDAITPLVQYGMEDFDKLERKEIEARLREIAARAAADPQVRKQLACLMKR